MARTPEELAHIEWLGYVQPVGLVVSIPALLAAQAHVNRNIIPDHQRFLACLPHDGDKPVPVLEDFGQFTRSVLGWREADLESVTPGDARHSALEVALPEYNETLRPTHVVRELQPKDDTHPWMLLVQVLPTDTLLDAIPKDGERHWVATPQAKFERLLRETQAPIGLLVTGEQIRLVYAPRGESSGYATFSVPEMAQVAGRPIFAALHMLLCEERLFSLGEKQRLPAILSDSRKYQSHVSNELAQQVLAALYELLRGFQSADEATKGELLRAVLAENPNHVYQGLLTVLMRLVFVLYAEDRDLLSSDPVYGNHYSVTGLYGRLREDAGRYPDTMDQRFGAWAQLLTLFRLVHDGGSHGELRIPARRGYLFDPDRYNFLEGRHWRQGRSEVLGGDFGELSSTIPRVPDGVIFRVLSNLLILDGERLSYRTLDVEQIGSVYETMMGFRLEVAVGRSIAIKPKKTHGAPTTINLDGMLGVKAADRSKWLKANTDQKVTGKAATDLKAAASVDDLLAALDRRIARSVTPNVVSRGTMILQPSDERRRSGSHYTPRSLTAPIVRTTLQPVLKQLGDSPTPEQILSLKVCDPAMGSGAFLVEVCRQLGDELVKSWHAHRALPKLPPDEDEVLHARRLVAQRCLYGVDRNPMAVDLSKLSLWLATLAKDHPFTFLDHALRCGDSLVGLSRGQISGFHWDEKEVAKRQKAEESKLIRDPIASRMRAVTEYRQQILAARDSLPYEELRQRLDQADEQLALARLTGDAVVAAFFSDTKDKQRKARLEELGRALVNYIGPQGRVEDRQLLASVVDELHGSEHPVEPFHWEIEFPEVFAADTQGHLQGGFDAIVGNPPYAGKNTLINGNRDGYPDWLKVIHENSHGNSDLVAHFFRRAFNLLRDAGSLGFIATNTVRQGDTRSTGLKWICTHGGTIYSAKKRFRWPGQAAVVVSVIHVHRGTMSPPFDLDGERVSVITAFLFHTGDHRDPERLAANEDRCFQGSIVLGLGFTFDDSDTSGTAHPVALMQALIQRGQENAECIFPYINGEEVNTLVELQPTRYAIDFFDRSLEEASHWPELLGLVREKVMPERARQKRKALRERWWQYAEKRPGLYKAVESVSRVIVRSLTSTNFSTFAFLPRGIIYDQTLIVFISDTSAMLATLCSRAHEAWTLFLGATMKDDPRYNIADCFETFPFPPGVLESTIGNSIHCKTLEMTGEQYDTFRSELIIRRGEGLTKTYNRFHDPDEHSPDILRLRELHAAMDNAVLTAYGWHDLAESVRCEYVLDYEDDEEEGEQSSSRRRKKPWRYRWPDHFRDEVLARLLALNKERAEQERLAGAVAQSQDSKQEKGHRKKRSTAKPLAHQQTELAFGETVHSELEQHHQYVLMLLRAWDGWPLTRRALNAGMILMLDDALRKAMLDNRKRSVRKKKLVVELNHVYTELEIDGLVSIDNSGVQQLIRFTSSAPSKFDVISEDINRLAEVQEFFRREQEAGKATLSEEAVDADFDFVPA